MPRPSKIELLARFFPEIRQKTSKADQEQAIAYNTLACEVVLADQLRLYDQGLARYGKGVLCVRLHQAADQSAYLPLADLQGDLEMAKSLGHAPLETFLQEVVDAIERTNPEQAGLILLVDNSSGQLFPIERDYPARAVQALLEEFAA